MPSHLHVASAPSDGDANASAAIRVVLADDHALMRSSLRGVLDGEWDIDVVAEAGDLESTVRYVQLDRPHVLVLGLRPPNGSGIAAIHVVLRDRVSDIGIVVATMECDPAFAQRALAAGALGFVSKHLADTELPPAVRAVARGERYVSPPVGARLNARRGGPV